MPAGLTPIASPLVKPAAFLSPVPTAATLFSVPEPEAIKDELEAFCADGPALDAFYRDAALEPQQHQHQHQQEQAVTVADLESISMLSTAAGSSEEEAAFAAAHGAIMPDVGIPALGLPPTVFQADGDAAAVGNTAFRAGTGAAGSPAMDMSAARLLRRTSVQDGVLGSAVRER
jgi:hypothetical protein